MSSEKVVVVIPARYGSTRLPEGLHGHGCSLKALKSALLRKALDRALGVPKAPAPPAPPAPPAEPRLFAAQW